MSENDTTGANITDDINANLRAEIDAFNDEDNTTGASITEISIKLRAAIDAFNNLRLSERFQNVKTSVEHSVTDELPANLKELQKRAEELKQQASQLYQEFNLSADTGKLGNLLQDKISLENRVADLERSISDIRAEIHSMEAELHSLTHARDIGMEADPVTLALVLYRGFGIRMVMDDSLKVTKMHFASVNGRRGYTFHPSDSLSPYYTAKHLWDNLFPQE